MTTSAPTRVARTQNHQDAASSLLAMRAPTAAPVSGPLGLQRRGHRAVDRLAAGRPLEGALRAAAETRFGEDFGDVRVHAGEQASTAARDVRARAYTVGADIVFGGGTVSTGDPTGPAPAGPRAVHVVQQRRGGTKAGTYRRGARARRRLGRARRRRAMGGDGGAATGVGLSRSVDDWLETTPNIQDETQWLFTASPWTRSTRSISGSARKRPRRRSRSVSKRRW